MKKSIPSVLLHFHLSALPRPKRAGSDAGASATTGSNNVYIGAGMQGAVGESDACYIKSIFSQTSASGLPVFINSNNSSVRLLLQ
jgi:hypothetical protein